MEKYLANQLSITLDPFQNKSEFQLHLALRQEEIQNPEVTKDQSSSPSFPGPDSRLSPMMQILIYKTYSVRLTPVVFCIVITLLT
jgi:hypothetical protein